jgi:hypothetical protein
MLTFTVPPSSKGEKVTIKAHGGPIDIEGVIIAAVNDKLQLQKIEVWFDPMDMFRQMKPNDETTARDKSVGRSFSKVVHRYLGWS